MKSLLKYLILNKKLKNGCVLIRVGHTEFSTGYMVYNAVLLYKI